MVSSPPKPVLVAVTVFLAALGLGGFILGFLQAQPHKAAADEAATAAGPGPARAAVKDAQPLVEPPPPPPKAKPAKSVDTASDAPTSDAQPPPRAQPVPVPSEAPPAAPPSAATPPGKLPDDLPPT
jgi:outer membrane biosynthesis protein TonB